MYKKWNASHCYKKDTFSLIWILAPKNGKKSFRIVTLEILLYFEVQILIFGAKILKRKFGDKLEKIKQCAPRRTVGKIGMHRRRSDLRSLTFSYKYQLSWQRTQKFSVQLQQCSGLDKYMRSLETGVPCLPRLVEGPCCSCHRYQITMWMTSNHIPLAAAVPRRRGHC